MAIETTFDTDLTDTTETDLVTLSADSGVLIGNLYVNTDDDSGSPSGFHTVNQAGDDLFVRLYIKDNAGNFKQTSRTVIVDQGQDERQITFGDQLMLERDIKITGQLGTDRGNVRLTGHIERVNQANQLAQVTDLLEIARGSVVNNGSNTQLQFDTDLSLGSDDVINRAQVSFGSGAAGANEFATPRDIIDYVDADGTIEIDEALPAVPSAGDTVIVHNQMSTILRG
jgi:hypothetical protein